MINNNLSKSLLENVGPGKNPTKTTYVENVESLCLLINNNEIVLPYYQTGVRWTDEKILNLLNFQINGYAPVAPISVNKITSKNISKVPQVTFIDRNTILEKGDIQEKISVNDGQQRLSANYFAFIDHPRVENFVLDLHKGKIIILNSIIEIKNYQIPIGKLMNKDVAVFQTYKDSIPYLKRNEVFNLLTAVRSKVFSYNYTINMARDLTEDEQLDWFWVLNNAGSSVSALQMMFAKHFEKGTDIHVDYLDKFIAILDGTKMNKLIQQETYVSVPIAALNPAMEMILGTSPHILNYSPISSDAHGKDFCKLNTQQIKNCFDITLTALDKAIDFIKTNDLKDPARMEYITFLTGLYIYMKNDNLNDIQKEKVIEWYNSTEFINTSNGERRLNFIDLLKIRHM